MKMYNLILLITLVGILFSSATFAYTNNSFNAEGGNYEIRYSLGGIAAEYNTDDDPEADTIEGFAQSSGGPIGNISYGDDATYDWSYAGFFGASREPELNITVPGNLSYTTSLEIFKNWTYYSMDDYAFLQCYYNLNNRTNITTPCNSTSINSSYILASDNEKWNTLDFYVKDSDNRITSQIYFIWVNTTASGIDPGPGGGGGGGYSPPPGVDYVTEEETPVGRIDDPLKENLKLMLEAAKSAIWDIGSWINKTNPYQGFMIILAVLIGLGFTYRHSDTLVESIIIWGDTDKEDKKHKKLSKKKEKWNW